jgi:phosphotransferase family enzyme
MTSARVCKRKVALPVEVYEAGYPVDPDFPQLEVATDPQRMFELFRAHLRPVAGRACVIRGCEPFRFRCRQSGGRCVLQYTLQLEDPGTGRRWDQWVTGLLYARPGEAERLWQELRGESCGELPDGWSSFEPVAFIPDLQMLVEVFPFDRRLPQLGPLLGGAVGELEPYLLERLSPAGRWEVTRRTVVPTRYRTELGAALKITLGAREAVSARTATVCCYLKVFRNRNAEETYAFLQACADRPGADASGFSVVRPLAYLREWRALALEEAAGVTLQELLLNGREPTVVARAVGRAVAAFNRQDVPISQHHTLDEQIADVRRAATLVEWASPGARCAVRQIVTAVENGLEEVAPAPIHRDVKPDHVFLAGDRVQFIDCDAVALGDPARDPAHLFAHIVGGVGLEAMPAAHRAAAAAVFVEEYFAHVPARWRQGFPLHCAGALVEVAAGIFKRQEPNWRRTVPAVVAEAEACLRQ